jgi:hypothetical protein
MTDQLAPIIGIRNGLILALLLWGVIFLLWEQADCWINDGTDTCVACTDDCLDTEMEDTK